MRTLAALCAVLCIAASPATKPPLDDSLNEKCDAVVAKWRDRFAAERMSYIVSPPFVVAGDGGQQKVGRYLDTTILAATRSLQHKFFIAKPDEPILILLFESDKHYRQLAKDWFGDEDVSHFGYFRHDNVMLMNVATGTGTLVHELVHALIKPDFPGVPSWFNEGLGSLFEQCSLADDDIRGLVNWRLPDLQRAIRDKTLRPLANMISDPDFYNDDHVGLNYAQARYLLMFLQESGQLDAYYKRFRAARGDDRSGLKQLKQIWDKEYPLDQLLHLGPTAPELPGVEPGDAGA
jgi:hypothetical protein